MKNAFVFPGQGAQFPGMGKDLYERSEQARARFQRANDILGFDIASIMFEGTVEALQKTSVTQPAIYIHSVILALELNIDQQADMVAGHSLGEFSALAVSGALSFEDGLKLVQIRANAMQKACDAAPSTMAAIVGMEDAAVEALCLEIGDVSPANYNSPGQLVVSGGVQAIQTLIEQAKSKGAKMAVPLTVNGAFHSSYMEPARIELEAGILNTPFRNPACPVYQNVCAKGITDPEEIRRNLVAQLTAPVRWTQSVQQMISDGATHFTEIGPGKVLQGLVKRIDKSVQTAGFQSLPDANL
jgi:[acyl-carrier-protein] S-malonyltransferase